MTTLLIIAGLIGLTTIASMLSYADVILETYYPLYKEASRHKIVPDLGFTGIA